MSNILACYQLLELNVISAQDLALVGRSMRTYAVAWIDPERKLSTRVDSNGHNNPTWNDKFVFRVEEDFFYEDTSLITIDIYALHWFKDIHVGTAEVLAGDLFPPPSKPSHNTYKPPNMQFMGLEVHRPSGHPKGIVNIGVVVLDSSKRSMPLYHHVPTDHVNHQAQAYPKLRRSKSDTSSMIGSEALAHEKRVKAKSHKTNSVISHSEISTKSKKKTSSILSGSSVKATTKKGKFGRRKTKVAPTSPEVITDDFNAIQRLMAPKKKVGYEAKPSPKPQFRSTPAIAYNATPIGAVKATPLHPFAKVNAMEYGTPRRSNMRNMVHQPIMTDSELGPSASEVAAAVARQPVVEEGDNSTVGGWSLDESVEELQPKVDRWRTDLAPVYDGCEMSSKPTSSSKKGRRSRRHTDGGGGNGLFSCFSVICGVECSIVCGGDGKKNRRRRAKSVDNNTSLL
ncbi:putative C2 domain-containing protein [Lupinus albus]|uniref:Putative C2 domain-containing protein n=1 Tax=Lupinus albus TaxID=3870 RepID=A0A6A4NNR7_LUPAL|nr:putative C2 domain-containing protein [Lupinus albus]